MKTFIFSGLLLIAWAAFAATPIAGGDVSGAWTLAGSPYQIKGDITVPKDQTLTIEPKVVVQFTGHYQFIVHGLLQTGDPKAKSHKEEDRVQITADLTQNSAGWGGIRFENAHAKCQLLDCDISNARASGEGTSAMGGAVYCENTNLAIANCALHDNSASAAGGAFASVNSHPDFANVTISKNTSSGAGGGIYATGGDVNLANVSISENTSGGIAVTGGQLNIANCSVTGNGGCGLTSTNCSVKIANCSFGKNEKGGITLDGGGLSLANCSIFGNTGLERGAGVFMKKADVNLVNASISDNTTGAVCALDNSTVTLTNCTLEAAAGKALDTDAGTTVTKINSRVKE